MTFLYQPASLSENPIDPLHPELEQEAFLKGLVQASGGGGELAGDASRSGSSALAEGRLGTWTGGNLVTGPFPQEPPGVGGGYSTYENGKGICELLEGLKDFTPLRTGATINTAAPA